MISEVVTKIKHPGRVASGKRLVEWNRQIKKSKQQKTEEPEQEPEQKPKQKPKQEPEQEPKQKPNQEPKQESKWEQESGLFSKYRIAGAIALTLGITVFFFWKRDPDSKTVQPENDIFHMN